MASILFVDDIPAIHDLLKGLIATTEHSCETAISGQSGLSLYQQKRFDAVVVDYSMEPMDGLEFMRAVLGLDPSAIVIIMSGYIDDRTAEKIMDAGAFAIVEKPFDLKQLLEVIESALNAPRDLGC